ncbi:tyrosine-type recombinase/integrase [Sedimentimonas flavescens]|uniref:tyrosine-type recombinase/integrase n=1 Tax=Sedimentimonas flavescens TaxID=2851012 RepID=UPI0021A900C3|nr:tyrosine-type recombinase/integrase [Sedimentimonas flavescens]MCT2538745.1 tyrosine-type recombinase/integrase [Sedimentimonas flavescens]
MKSTAKITFSSKGAMERLKAKATPYIAWDAGYGRGFGSLGVRVATSGDATILVYYRVGEGRKAKQSKKVLHRSLRAWLAKSGNIDELRQEARNFVAAAQKSGLTTTEQQEAKEAAAEVEQAARDARAEAEKTITQLGKEYLARRTKTKPYKGREARQAELAVERAAKVWGDKPLAALTTSDAEDLMVYIRENHGPQAANKARGLLQPMLKHARRSMKSVDATIFAEMEINKKDFAAQPRTTVMNAEERDRFFRALKSVEASRGAATGRHREAVKDKIDALRLIYLTAARKGEWLKARWGHLRLDPTVREWDRPDENRKNGAHTMKLPTATLPILERIHERHRAEGRPVGNDDLVFGTFSETTLRDAFLQVKKVARITSDLCIHDLRASRVTEWATGEPALPPSEIAHMIGSSDVATLIRHYARDGATEEQKLARVDRPGDAEML